MTFETDRLCVGHHFDKPPETDHYIACPSSQPIGVVVLLDGTLRLQSMTPDHLRVIGQRFIAAAVDLEAAIAAATNTTEQENNA